MKNKSDFYENGFFIEKNLYNNNDMDEIFLLFYDVFLSLQKKLIPSSKNKYPANVNRETNLDVLDDLMMECFKYDKNIIGEGYDIISYSSTFLRFLSNKKIELLTKQLLGLSNTNSLYGWTNRIRIDPPSDERRTYGWHQEVFYTIPQSKYLQTWAPVIRNTTSQNGTIWIAPKSHKEGVAKASWTEKDGRATQIIVDPAVMKKFEKIELEMNVGDVLFFDGKLAHKSGHNSTADEIRFSLVGMWHNIWEKHFRGPKPNFDFRSPYTPKEYWSKCNEDLDWGF
tara:strand:- start:263 stop:1111 length:849 start_codon:yes stop_codon:yes gene_type:complete